MSQFVTIAIDVGVSGGGFVTRKHQESGIRNQVSGLVKVSGLIPDPALIPDT